MPLRDLKVHEHSFTLLKAARVTLVLYIRHGESKVFPVVHLAPKLRRRIDVTPAAGTEPSDSFFEVSGAMSTETPFRMSDNVNEA